MTEKKEIFCRIAYVNDIGVTDCMDFKIAYPPTLKTVAELTKKVEGLIVAITPIEIE